MVKHKKCVRFHWLTLSLESACIFIKNRKYTCIYKLKIFSFNSFSHSFLVFENVTICRRSLIIYWWREETDIKNKLINIFVISNSQLICPNLPKLHFQSLNVGIGFFENRAKKYQRAPLFDHSSSANCSRELLAARSLNVIIDLIVN